MKESRYNFFYKRENDYVVYNSLTNSLAKLSNEEFDSLKYLDLSQKEISNFKYGGYILDDDLDELDFIKESLLKSRYGNRSLGLTIAPTLDCNFACVYCYEKEHSDTFYMDEKTIENVISFVANKAKNSDSIDVSWYGGEPLLAYKTIDRLSEAFIKIAESENIPYRAYIITNGYLLNEKIAKKFSSWKIEGMQITIDGDRDSHNKKRFLRNGSPTYDKILINLKENYDYLVNLSLRINLDQNNIGSESSIINYIESFDKDRKIRAYISRVRNENDTYNDEVCIGQGDFEKYKMQFYKSQGIDFVEKLYPNIIRNFCTADTINSYVINYNGDLYKCWSDIGIEEKKIARLEENMFVESNYKNYYDYLLYDPTEDEECRECKVLPICMGGCPYARKNSGKECSTYKDNLEEIIMLVAKNKEKENEISNNAK